MSLCPRLARDFRRYREIQGWSVARTLIDALFLSSGFQALIAYRLGHWFKRAGIPLVPALLRRISIAFCAIDILPQAKDWRRLLPPSQSRHRDRRRVGDRR